MELLKRKNVKISGKRAVVIGRSNIVGMPVALLLQAEDATVTVIHSRTSEPEVCSLCFTSGTACPPGIASQGMGIASQGMGIASQAMHQWALANKVLLLPRYQPYSDAGTGHCGSPHC